MDPDAIAQFAGITGSSDSSAAQYLGLAEGNTEQAIELFYANDGADLQTSSASSHQAPPASQIPTRSDGPRSDRHGYQDVHGVVHIDSDQDDEGHIDEDEDVEVTSYRSRAVPSTTRPLPSSRTIRSATSPSNRGPAAIDDDEAVARRLQEEFYGAAGQNGTSGNASSDLLDEHGYRAPIGRTTETLVGPGSMDPSNAEEMRAAVMEQMMARRQPPRNQETRGIFNQATASSIWNNADTRPDGHRNQLAQATGGASEASSKSSLLAEMYRPPFEIISRLPWDQARQQGRDGEKWILVNIHDPSIFDCQVLNRDIWKNSGVKDTLKENFIFMQYSKDDPKGNQYMQYYFPNRGNQDAYPHIAIVDPRTGEQVKVWSGPPTPKPMDFLMQLHEFLDRYSLNVAAKNPVARRKPEPKKETQVDRMTEEQMLEMALQASLSGGEKEQDVADPDDLTRSTSHVQEEKGKGKERSPNAGTDDIVETATEANGSASSADSPFNTISSSNTHAEPPAEATGVTRIQFRHPSGRVVRKFALADTVRRLFEWLKASPLEGKQGVEFELIFMGKNLIEVLDHTIDQAGLKNGTVMIEFIES